MSQFRLLFILFLAALLAVQLNCPAQQAVRGTETFSQTCVKLLDHYSGDSDSLKQEAARFLTENMEGHGYVTYDLRDSTSQVIEFNVLDFENFEALETAFDSLEEIHGTLDFKRRDFIKDTSVVTAEFLIDHIDFAFKAWRTRPWAKDLTFDKFLEYVLPYRGSNEPLERWRQQMYDAYDSIMESMNNPTDPIEAAALINRDLMSWFRFDPRFYYHPTDQGLAEMKENRLGRCEDMTNLTIYAMRANGLAVTSDYTPYWANSGNNHAWNAIITPQGSVIPFMGAEANPGEYKLANKLAKAYRKTFSIRRDNPAFLVDYPDALPKYLSSKSYVDVTPDYTTVCDVTVHLREHYPDSVEFAYLCVFNSGEWKPIHWSKIRGDSTVFTDMGTDVAYLPALYLDEEVKAIDAPFILNTESQIQRLEPDTLTKSTLRLISTTRIKQEASTDGISRTHLITNRDYELYYWSEDWQSAGSSRAGDEALIFENIPSNCLYWLVEADSDREERIFTYENGTQIWW